MAGLFSKTALGLLLAATLPWVPPANADAVTRNDANDSPSRLDIAQVRHAHHFVGSSGQRLLRHTLTTHERWRTRLLRDGSTFIEFDFDTDMDDVFDHRLTVDTYRGSLSAVMDDPNEEGSIFGYALVWRSGRDRVTVQFPPDLLGSPDAYAWYAETRFSNPHHDDCWQDPGHSVVCVDRAPNGQGKITHTL